MASFIKIYNNYVVVFKLVYFIKNDENFLLYNKF